MAKKLIPALQRFDSQGRLTKTIIPDLKLKFEGDIALEGIKDRVNTFLIRNDLTEIIFSNKDDWRVKEIDGTSYKWVQIESELEEKTTCRNTLPKAASHMVSGVFAFTALLGTYFTYFFTVVNGTPKQTAGASAIADLVQEFVVFGISQTSENLSNILTKLSSKKIPESGYDLNEDLEIAPATKKYLYLIAMMLAALQLFNMAVDLRSSYINMMKIFEAAFEEGDVENISYEDFMRLANTSFFLDTIFQLVVPFNLLLKIVPKVEQLVEKMKSFVSPLTQRCQNSDSRDRQERNPPAEVKGDPENGIQGVDAQPRPSLCSRFSFWRNSENSLPTDRTRLIDTVSARGIPCVIL